MPLLGLIAAGCLLVGCGSDPLATPIDWFHDLEGGEIAQQRPPPPGAGQPYPKLGTVPARPVMTEKMYRNALQAQLLAERDRTERVAADTPIGGVPPVPPKPVAAKPVAPGDAAQSQAANATLDTAEAPPAPAAAKPVAVSPSVADPAAGAGPVPGTPVTLAGAPMSEAGAPAMPDAPPPPATFEGVAAEPLPTVSLVQLRLPPPEAGTPIYFGDGSAVLPVSQRQALRDFLGHRGAHGVEIIGLGEATSDTPEGQATAVALALARARAVAAALGEMHVPQGAMRVGADAFGRGAVLRLLP